MRSLFIVSAVLLATAIVSLLAYFIGSEKEAIPRALTLGFMTVLLGGGGSYFVIYMIRMRQLDIPPHELADGEVIWARTSEAGHYRSGSILKFWELVGGKLFLTNERLEFRINPAELSGYKVVISLQDIRRASSCRIALFRRGLKVERDDGTYELFTFGFAPDESRKWADAIMAFRDDLEEREADARCH